MDEQKLWNFGPFRLDARNEQLWHEQEVLHLTNKALAVLCYLVEHQGQLVTKDDLFAAVWPEVVVSDAALVVCIRELRQTLGDERRTPRFIETVHGRGYRFVAAVAAPVPSAEFRVLSQEEESQKPALSALEGVNGKAVETAIETETEIETEEAPSPDVESHAQDSALRTQHLPAARFTRSLVLAAVLLVIFTVLVVQYLSRPTLSTQDSLLRTEPAPQVLALPDKPSILVLPFVNLSGDPAQEYFSDGVTGEITATLSRVAGLFVIARTSAFTYKGKAVKVQDISREMGVRYVLEGSVQKADEQVRIIVQLIDATTGKHLWSERYDRPLQNIFALQDEIRQQIASALQVRLAPEESGTLRSPPTTNLDAYDFYLRGADAVWRAMYKNDPLTTARQMFENAIALDPQYAEAYARLGGTYLADWFFEPARNQGQSLARALAMGQRAVALNDTLPLPHAILGSVYVWKRQYDQALVEARRAVTLDPNFAEGYFHLGTVLFFAGSPDESITAYEQSVRLDPKSPDLFRFNLVAAYQIAGRCKEALALGEQLAARHPDYAPVYLHLAACYADLNRLEEASAKAAEVLRLLPAFSLAAFEGYWPMKDPATMERTLAGLRKAGLK